MGLFGLLATVAAIPVQLVEIPVRAIETFTAPDEKQEAADVLRKFRRQLVQAAAKLDDE